MLDVNELKFYHKNPSAQVTDELKNIVVNFFSYDDISRQTPDIKILVVARKKDEIKNKYQIRYLVECGSPTFETKPSRLESR